MQNRPQNSEHELKTFWYLIDKLKENQVHTTAFGRHVVNGEIDFSSHSEEKSNIASTASKLEGISSSLNLKKENSIDTHSAKTGKTALMEAAITQEIEIAKILLDHDVTVDAVDNLGKTALMYATETDQLEMVTLLINNGADASRVDKEGNNSLMYAAKLGFSKILSFFLSLIPTVAVAAAPIDLAKPEKQPDQQAPSAPPEIIKTGTVEQPATKHASSKKDTKRIQLPSWILDSTNKEGKSVKMLAEDHLKHLQSTREKIVPVTQNNAKKSAPKNDEVSQANKLQNEIVGIVAEMEAYEPPSPKEIAGPKKTKVDEQKEIKKETNTDPAVKKQEEEKKKDADAKRSFDEEKKWAGSECDTFYKKYFHFFRKKSYFTSTADLLRLESITKVNKNHPGAYLIRKPFPAPASPEDKAQVQIAIHLLKDFAAPRLFCFYKERRFSDKAKNLITLLEKNSLDTPQDILFAYNKIKQELKYTIEMSAKGPFSPYVQRLQYIVGKLEKTDAYTFKSANLTNEDYLETLYNKCKISRPDKNDFDVLHEKHFDFFYKKYCFMHTANLCRLEEIKKINKNHPKANLIEDPIPAIPAASLSDKAEVKTAIHLLEDFTTARLFSLYEETRFSKNAKHSKNAKQLTADLKKLSLDIPQDILVAHSKIAFELNATRKIDSKGLTPYSQTLHNILDKLEKTDAYTGKSSNLTNEDYLETLYNSPTR